MKRFAIQFPNGLFSNGAKCLPVKFEKAKLWRLRNHVTAHLSRFSGNPYPAGTNVVEVEISHTASPVFLVENYMREKLERDRVERAKREKQWAERQVERAKKDLQEAEARLRRAKT